VEVPVGSDQHAFLPTIPELAREYVREMRHQQPAGPYFLCGYCWAGALTFEMARQLVAEGAQVGLLALIDSGCPGSRQASSGARRRAAGPGRTYWGRLGLNLRRLANLEPKAIPEFLRERVANLAGRLGGPALYRWSVRLGRPLLPAFRGVRGALLQAVRSYQPERYPGRITLFRAQPVEAVPPRNPAWGWDRVAEGGVDVHLVPGEHLTIVQEPSVGALALELRTCLDQAKGEGAAPPVSRALAG
jgi:aspartate racemase